MKSTYLLLISCLLVSTISNAQNFLEFSAGVSAPVGAFSKADAGTFNHWNNTAGFAKTGYTLGVEAAHLLTKNLGVAGTFYFSNHGGFSANDASTLSASYTDAFAVDESTVSTKGAYQSVNLMVGPGLFFPINKFSVGVRAMAGVVKSLSTPEMTVLLEDQSAATFSQQSSKATAFGWQIGARLQYALTEKLGLSLKTDYFQSGGLTIKNDNRTNNAGRLVEKQPLAWINASVGLTFLLAR